MHIPKPFAFTVNRHRFSFILFAVFLFSLIPLFVIALYNYPAADDFTFVLPVTNAWKESGSLLHVLRVMAENTLNSYRTWQGNFFSVFCFMLTPMVFDIRLYFLSNWLMLLLILFSCGYLVSSVLHALHTAENEFHDDFRILFSLFGTLIIQFLPHISDGVYWWNGAQYMTASCLALLLIGLLLRLYTQKERRVLRTISACLLAVMLGGSFYGPALGVFVVVCGTLLMLKSRKHPFALPLLFVFFCFAISFAVSILAPGNAIRQTRVGEGSSLGILQTFFSTFTASLEVIGGQLTPQWFVIALLTAVALWSPIKNSGLSFGHPLLIFAVLYAMLAGCIAPGIYTGFGYSTERYFNSVYISFAVFSLGTVLYCEGSLIRFLERHAEENADHSHLLLGLQSLGKSYGIRFLCVLLCIMILGACAGTVMNLPSIDAVKSLLNGNAKGFYQSMLERENEVLTVENFEDMTLHYYENKPAVFKHDSLPFKGIYGTIRYYKWYLEALRQ